MSGVQPKYGVEEQKTRKKRRFELIGEGWGELNTNLLLNKEREQAPPSNRDGELEGSPPRPSSLLTTEGSTSTPALGELQGSQHPLPTLSGAGDGTVPPLILWMKRIFINKSTRVPNKILLSFHFCHVIGRRRSVKFSW